MTYRRVKTPTMLQMQPIECGAASLGIILSYYKKYVPLEELRYECGVSRDGSDAEDILRGASRYHLNTAQLESGAEEVARLKPPFMVRWNQHHFLIVEGFSEKNVYLNDPASGPRRVSKKEFDKSYSGTAITFEPGAGFQPGGKKTTFWQALRERLSGLENALWYVGLAGVALIVPGLAIPVCSRLFIDHVLIGRMDDWVAPLLLGMIISMLLRAGFIWLRSYHIQKIESRLSIAMSSHFFWHILRLPVSFFTHRAAGELSGRVGVNDRVANQLSRQLLENAIDVVSIVFFALIMFQYDVLLTSIGIIMAALNLMALRLISRRQIDNNFRLKQETDKLTGTATSGLQMIETLKATGTESDFYSRWAGFQTNVSNAEMRLGQLTGILSSVPILLTAMNSTIILAVGSYRIIEGELTIGMLVAFQSLMSSFTTPVTNLVNLNSVAHDVEVDLNRIDDSLRSKLDIHFQEAAEEDINLNAQKLDGYIEFRNVTFGYSKLEPPLIENFNLKLKPGERVALIGGSGSGKSTVAKLLAGIYEPWSGEILFDGKPRKDLPRRVLNNSLGVVDQDIFLFEGTIKDIITLWDYTLPESFIIQAARDACIHEIITSRPGGYAGKLEEAGRNFSGGQRQRLEITRALCNNPSMLILDEATSALDPATEALIDTNIRRRGCTCLIVAHRLSTIRDCDEIIVMQYGKIMQRGTHDQMKDQPGLYGQLIRTY